MGYNRLIKIYPNPANPGQYMMMVAVHPSSYAEAEKDNVPVCWRYKSIAFTHENKYLPGECPQPSTKELLNAITITQKAAVEAAKRARAEMAIYDTQMRSPEYQAVSKNMNANSEQVVALLDLADERLAMGDKKGHDELTDQANALERDNEANHKEWLAPMDQRLAASEKNIALCDLTSDLYEIKCSLIDNRSYAAPTWAHPNDPDWYTRDLNPKYKEWDETYVERALRPANLAQTYVTWHHELGMTFSEYMVKRVEEIKDELRHVREETLAMLRDMGDCSATSATMMVEPSIEYIDEPYSHKYWVGGGPEYWEGEVYKHAQYEFYQESLPPEKRDPTYVSDKDRYEAHQKEAVKEAGAIIPLAKSEVQHETDLSGPDDLTQDEMDYIDKVRSPDAQADEVDSETELDSDQGEVYYGSDSESEPEPEVKSKPMKSVAVESRYDPQDDEEPMMARLSFIHLNQ